MPNRFGKLHKTFLTPVWSILASGLLIGLAITFFNIESIAKLASAFILLVYVSENVAVIVFEKQEFSGINQSIKARCTHLIKFLESLVEALYYFILVAVF